MLPNNTTFKKQNQAWQKRLNMTWASSACIGSIQNTAPLSHTGVELSMARSPELTPPARLRSVPRTQQAGQRSSRGEKSTPAAKGKERRGTEEQNTANSFNRGSPSLWQELGELHLMTPAGPWLLSQHSAPARSAAALFYYFVVVGLGTKMIIFPYRITLS